MEHPTHPQLGRRDLTCIDVASRPFPSVSTVPGWAEARFDCRFLPGETPESVCGLLRDAATRAERLRRLSALQRDFDALPVDTAVAASYGQLAAAVVEIGRQPWARTMDLLIAATAHAHDARLYTRNAKDLIGLEQLIEIVPV